MYTRRGLVFDCRHFRTTTRSDFQGPDSAVELISPYPDQEGNIKYTLFFSDLKEPGIFSTDFRKILTYQIL
jgi:hypothetical protein